MSEVVEVRTTAPGGAAAESIAEALVGERLAACVHLWPIRSVYRWRGAVERAEEHVLSIRTRAERAAAVRERILALHPYETPEVVVLPITGGAADYLAWIAEETA